MAESMAISAGQIRAINVALGVRGLADDKEEIISIYTNGRTTNEKEMFMHEARLLLMNVNGPDINELMIRKMFALAHELTWIKKVQKVDEKGNLVPANDYSVLYNWVLKYGYLNKELREYTYKELPKLISQFENGPYKNYISNSKK
jgi:hypothetical protein